MIPRVKVSKKGWFKICCLGIIFFLKIFWGQESKNHYPISYTHLPICISICQLSNTINLLKNIILKYFNWL